MNKYFEETVKSISELVRFDSSQSKALPGAPFGTGAAECLTRFLELARDLGFETHNYDNYVGEVIYGEGAQEFAVLCHLDVVPAGEGWTKDPFGGAVEDGKIWGRGTTDDKGPAVCCLYALKSLRNEGFSPSAKIKLIVGCNEENGWGCIEHYRSVATLPETGFSPDADFPVIYAEKGILHLRLHFPLPDAPFLSLRGGAQANMVCERCESVPKSTKNIETDLRGSELRFDGRKLTAFGKSAHASTPEEGKNAIEPLLCFYETRDKRIRKIRLFLFGDGFGLRTLRDETGALTLSPDVIRYHKGELIVTADIRYPATMKKDAVLSRIDLSGIKYEILHFQPPLFHDKNSPLIRELLSVYEECTNTRAEPIAIGGGTYARALKNCVGFGPEMAGEVSSIHQADEFISLERVNLLLEIYEKAIRRLTK